MTTESIRKRAKMLGMNPSTASGRLVKDLLYKFICDTDGNDCFRCGEQMSRDNFTIEHKESWMQADNPLECFFDLDNVSFSHSKCNSSASVPNPKREITHGTEHGYHTHRCRCQLCTRANTEGVRKRRANA